MDESKERWDECFCCEDPFRESQLDEDGHCTMCSEARSTFNRDRIPAGRPCCRRYLSECLKKGVPA